MKTSWVVGMVQLYLLILAAEIIVTGGTILDPNSFTILQGLAGPTITNTGTSVSGLVSIVTNMGSYFMWFISLMFLYSPTIWTGKWLWIYLYGVFPFCIAMIFGLVSLLRGVGTS